jgi:hypothetical protein
LPVWIDLVILALDLGRFILDLVFFG